MAKPRVKNGGHKCEICRAASLGYCPYDAACKKPAWERFRSFSYNKFKDFLAEQK